MKEELLVEILEKLKEKYPIKAKKLEKLVKEYEEEPTEEIKQRIGRKIYNYVYQIFSQQLSAKSRQEFSDLTSCIGEDSYQIERRENGEWAIGYSAAVRRVIEGDKVVIKNIIPREYQKGYHLSTKLAESKEERLREVAFLKKYAFQLDRISTMMDKKIEIQSGEYTLKNSSISQEFVDLLVDFLEFRTVETEKARINVKEKR